jgi:two-component system nitrate/nitrite response regulator NarL
VRRAEPDVLVVDAGGQELTTALAEIDSARPAFAFSVVAIVEDDEDVVRCARARVAGVALRDAPGREVVATVEAVAAGERACSPDVVPILLERIAAVSRSDARGSPLSDLTKRELEVLALIERGLANKEIARRLSIGLPTVKNHVHRILKKLQAHRRGEAAALARGLRVARLPATAPRRRARTPSI